MRVGDEPVVGRSGDCAGKVGECFGVKVNMLCALSDEGASFTDIREGGGIRSGGGG